MNKKIISVLLITLLVLCQSAFAAEFVQLGECPITNMDESSPAITLDIFENEIYGNTQEISRQEWFNTTTLHSIEEKPDIPFSKKLSVGEASEFNDGVQFRHVSGYYEQYGSEEQWYEYVDINGKVLLSTLPIGWQRTWDYHNHYNFGFFTQGVEEIFMPDYASYYTGDVDFAESTITNAFTGQVYKLNGICISSISNSGVIYFFVPVMRGGEYSEKFYKADLKKTAAVTVYYDEEKIAFDQVPVIENGRTLVPLRAIFEKIGADVEWDSANRAVIAKKGDTKISLTIDNPTATINDKEVTLETPAKIIGGRTLVPVRFVADCFGVGVDWYPSMQLVSLTSAK